MSNSDHLPDDVLLAAVARVWELTDPPPRDLADGVLARLAAEDLEFELLTLVESVASSGVRHGGEEGDESGAWSLEYAGPDFHAYLRLSRIEDETRLDGWIVPAREVRVELRPDAGGPPLLTEVDEFGRFEIERAGAGLHRLAFVEEDPDARARITPPFWI
jgi:hypothetical protein